jgi:hypothetical protein
VQAGAVPAAPHQRRGQLPGPRAAPDSNVTHPEAHRLDVAGEQVVVVAVGVLPLLLRRVTGPPVELDAQPVRVVEVVQVPNAADELAPRLPPSRG